MIFFHVVESQYSGAGDVLFIKFFVSYHFFLKLMCFQPVIAYSNFDQ